MDENEPIPDFTLPEHRRAARRMLCLLWDLIRNRHTGKVTLDCKDGIPLGCRIEFSQSWKR